MGSSAVNVGIVGSGYGLRVLLPAFRSLPGCRVVALACSDLAKAQAAAKAHGIERAQSWRSMVSDERVDLIAIAVPPALQPTIAEAALKRGKRVFCEKPLAADLRGARRILRAARRKNSVAVDLEFTQMPAWKKARELVRAGKIGSFSHAVINWQIQTYANEHGIHNWKADARQGGGALLQFASHSLHALEWFFGPASRLSARLGRSKRHPWKGIVEARVWLDFKGGGSASLLLHTDAPFGTGQHFEIYGSTGGLLVYSPDTADTLRFALLERRKGPKGFVPVAMVKDPSGQDARLGAVRRLAGNWLAGRAGHYPGPAEGLRVQRLIHAVERSDRAGRWVSV